MKKLCYSACMLMLAAFLVVSCADGTIGDTFAEDQYDPSGGTIITYSNVAPGFFDIGDPDNSVVGFDVDGYTGAEPSNIALIATLDGVEAKLADVSGALPASITVSMTDFLAAFGKTAADVAVGDAGAIFFDATNSSGTFRSQNALNTPFSCLSSLAGDHPYVSTNFAATSPYAGPCPDRWEGVITWTELSAGSYLTSDLGFGQYASACWSDNDATSATATFSDVCNSITTGAFEDQYALVYEWVLTGISGPEMSISWSNNYGDSGDVVITKEDGGDWPPLTIN